MRNPIKCHCSSRLGVGHRVNNPSPPKKTGCYRNQKMDNNTTITGGVAAGALITLLLQSQREAQRPKGGHGSSQATDDHRLLECGDHGRRNTGRASSQGDGGL